MHQLQTQHDLIQRKTYRSLIDPGLLFDEDLVKLVKNQQGARLPA